MYNYRQEQMKSFIEKQNVVTKLSLATEEIYKYHMEKIAKEKVKK